MSFPRYEQYKDSGVEWLGEVPEHWGFKRLILLASINDDALPESTSPDFEMEYLDISSVTPGSKRLAAESIKFGDAPSRARRIVKDGDILVSTVRTYLRAIAPINDPPGNLIASTGFAVVRPKQGRSTIFLNYALQASNFIEEVIARSTGVSYPAISAHELGFIKVPIPQLIQDQERIGLFLDIETEKIDVLIEQQRQLIQFLKEKRQTVISHAVTKGLDNLCPMKPSGVGWLGDIPASWNTVGSRRLFRLRNERAWDSDQQLTASQKYGMLLQTEFVELEGRRVVEVIQGTDTLRHVAPNDFVISLRSFQGGIEWCKLAGSVTFHYVVLTPIKNVHPPFFAYLFKSMAYIQALRSTTNLIRDGQDLRYSHFVLLDLPLVPLEEQEEIASYLDHKIPAIDALVAEAQVAIERLQERRSALISAAVTGKIDVRFSMRKGVASVKPYTSAFAHQVLAAKILASCNDSHMGRTKLQKLIHVTEYHAQIEDLRGNYTRKMAGPLNMKAMISLEQGLEKQRWYKTVSSDKRYRHLPQRY
jgi:type I restriction enzyme S subunit